jgi:hypothetical protein
VKFTAGTSKMIAESKIVAGSKPQVGSKVVVQPPNPQAATEANKYGYRNNYKGKNPMTRTQWRRFQRRKKLAAQQARAGGNANEKGKAELVTRPVKERLAPIKESDTENIKEDENEEDFMDDGSDFDVLVNVVSVLP